MAPSHFPPPSSCRTTNITARCQWGSTSRGEGKGGEKEIANQNYIQVIAVTNKSPKRTFPLSSAPFRAPPKFVVQLDCCQAKRTQRRKGRRRRRRWKRIRKRSISNSRVSPFPSININNKEFASPLLSFSLPCDKGEDEERITRDNDRKLGGILHEMSENWKCRYNVQPSLVLSSYTFASTSPPHFTPKIAQFVQCRRRLRLRKETNENHKSNLNRSDRWNPSNASLN